MREVVLIVSAGIRRTRMTSLDNALFISLGHVLTTYNRLMNM